MDNRTSEKNSRSSPWFEEWFDRDEYKLVYRHRDENEAEQVVSLIRALAQPSEGDQILDVGCGRGRHAILLAACGYEVTGIDLSSRSIAEAKQAAAEAEVKVRFEIADMRDAVCSGCFDGVVNLFTAFGYFHEDADHQTALTAMAEALKPNGWLIQDFLNADAVREQLVPYDSRYTDSVRIDQRRWIEHGRINKRIEIRDQKTNEESVFDESVRLLDLAELERMHRRAGLRLERVVGDYAGGPRTLVSPRAILLSRKC